MNELEDVPILNQVQTKRLHEKITNYLLDFNVCWLWVGCVDQTGHGRISLGFGTTKKQKTFYVHRLVYLLHGGPLKYTEDLHHHCNNKKCVNPKHLLTLSRNEHGRVESILNSNIKQLCKRGHYLVGNNLVLDRLGRRKGCKECDKLRSQSYRLLLKSKKERR